MNWRVNMRPLRGFVDFFTRRFAPTNSLASAPARFVNRALDRATVEFYGNAPVGKRLRAGLVILAGIPFGSLTRR